MAWENIVKAPEIDYRDLGIAAIGGRNAINNLGNTTTQLSNTIKQRARNKATAELLDTMDYQSAVKDPITARERLLGTAGNLYTQDASMPYMEQLGLIDQAIKPAIDERDFNVGREDEMFDRGIANARLALARQNANRASAPSYQLIEDINPYTGTKTPYLYNPKDPNKTPIPLNLDGKQLKDKANTPTGDKQASIGDFVDTYTRIANANPLDTGNAGLPIAGQVVEGSLPKETSNDVTWSQPDRYGVSMSNDGLFRDAQGNYIIPLALQEAKEVKRPDGSTEYVVINTRTGKDAQGKVVGDAPELTDTKVSPSGTKYYVDSKGKPILDESGNPIVAGRDASTAKGWESVQGIVNLTNDLNLISDAIKQRPGAIGSIGSGVGNWAGNQIQDIVQSPTEDYKARNLIDGYSGRMASTLRNMVETGVMTDKDFERYIKLVPNADDSVEIANQKMDILSDVLLAKLKPLAERGLLKKEGDSYILKGGL